MVVFGSVSLLNLDSFVFGMHCKVTAVVLFAFSIIVASSQYFGVPIDCTVIDQQPATSDFLDLHCWVHSTFTIPGRMASEVVGRDVPYPGVGFKQDSPERYHKYYTWVWLVLLFQALLFYFPRYLWKTWEAGRMKMLVLNLNCPIITEEKSNEKLNLLADCLMKNMHRQNDYAVRYFFCEVLNLVNVVAQFFLIDVFLGGEFSTYGMDVWRTTIDQEERVDPMAKIFPKAAMCTYHFFGQSGVIKSMDAVCLLPLNNLNEKIYLVIWFWFIFLAIMNVLSLFSRLTVLLSAEIRVNVLRARARFVPPKYVKLVSRRCQIGDWFVLLLLSKNMDPLWFEELISELARQLEQ